MNDLHILDLQNMSWIPKYSKVLVQSNKKHFPSNLLKIDGKLPEVRSGHSGLIYERSDGSDCMLIYGGSNGFKVLDCVH